MTNYSLWGMPGPATWPGWLSVVAFILLLSAPGSRRSLRAAQLCAAGAVTLFIGFGILPTGYWLIRPLETRFPVLTPSDARIFQPDHIVVLAGAESLAASGYRQQLEVNAAAERLIDGAALAQENPTSQLWIVGGVRRAGQHIADVEWTYSIWRRLGIAPSRIHIIDHTYDTCGNAAGVAAARPSGRILLATSAAHMPRAMACFEAQDLKPTPYPVDFRQWQASGFASLFSPDLLENMRRTDTALHEWVGLVWYRLSGRTRSLLPSP